MTARYRTVDAARAADLDRRQIDVLIRREAVTPAHTPEMGEARLFTEDEIIRLAVLGEVLRFGIPASRAASIAARFPFLKAPFALVIWHGFMELVPPTERGAPGQRLGGPNAVYVRQDYAPAGARQADDSEGQHLSFDVVRMEDLGAFLAKPMIAAAAVVPFDRIEARVKAHLAKAKAY